MSEHEESYETDESRQEITKNNESQQKIPENNDSLQDENSIAENSYPGFRFQLLRALIVFLVGFPLTSEFMASVLLPFVEDGPCVSDPWWNK